MSLKDLVFPSFAQMLEGSSRQLDKATVAAEAKGSDVEALLSARLAPDMLSLSSQLRFACLQATEAHAHLLGGEAEPVPPVETLGEAQDLIARTVMLLRSAEDGEAKAEDDSPVSIDLPNGMSFELTLSEYVRSWALPQFYFHLVAAYAIMRHNGVDLGKADYVGHMSRFVRQEGLPGAG